MSAAARNGVSGAIVLRGDPGIGKTMLLAHAVHDLPGMRVLRADGFEAETAMPYAGIQRLVDQLGTPVDPLPARQRDALLIATGREPGTPPGGFLVGLGLLSLLALTAEATPLVCVVDDAHLMDAESLEILAFVGRRLSAESVLLMMAARDDDAGERAMSGLPQLRLDGLDAPAAAALLTSRVRGDIDPYLAARIAEQSAGNPLVLHDLAAELTASELEHRSLDPDPIPLGPRLDAHYVGLTRSLPPASRAWLEIAAAETTGDIALIDAVARDLAVPPGAESGAERAGLVSVGDLVRFRHPLVRAAVYGDMTSARRRHVHDALARHSVAFDRPLVAAWHAAATVTGVDAGVADRLHGAADEAGSRGGMSSRARLLARSATLTPAGPVRDQRLLDAAEAALASGAALFARELLDRIDPVTLDDVAAGRVIAARAVIPVFLGDPAGMVAASSELLRAARRFEGVAPEREQSALMNAFGFSLSAEWAMTGTTLRDIGLRLRERDSGDDDAASIALRGVASLILDPYEEAVPSLRLADRAIDQVEPVSLPTFTIVGVAITIGTWNVVATTRLLRRAARWAREAGDLQTLDTTLWMLSTVELTRSDPGSARRAIEQVRELRRAIGYEGEHVVNGALLAWLGAAREDVVAVCDALAPTGVGGAWTIARAGLAIRDLADGRYSEAYENLSDLATRPFAQATFHHMSEFVEAAVRAGRMDDVPRVIRELRRHATAAGTSWVRGVLARAEALCAPDHEAEHHHLDAVGHLAAAEMPGELARAHLLYGEWLRRARRRREAADQLRIAWQLFDRIEAKPFAERARRELEICGVVVPAEGSAEPALTAQESSVARLAARGSTNAEIGAMLFISPNTVDYHLRKIFRKLGITSRRQLAEHLARTD